jgi:hypothetical protein
MNQGRRGVSLVGALGILLGVAALAAPVFAEEHDATRMDLFDTRSNRTGSAIVDERTGRVDVYDVRSNRTGSGVVDRGGTLQLFDTKGNRVGSGQITPGTPRSTGGRR